MSKGEYEECEFKGCTFANLDLSEYAFIDCEFIECDLSNILVKKTAFKEVLFQRCKMLGVLFRDCQQFLLEMKFEQCRLNLSSFYALPLKQTSFTDCQLQEVDFETCDLGQALINGCDLTGALFENTNLEQADLRGSFNFSLDPELNNIQGAKFSAAGLVGLLKKYNIDVE